MEFLIHCVELKMWPGLLYVQIPPFFHNSSIVSILGFLNVGLGLYLHFFPSLQRDWKMGYLNVALDWTCQFFPIYKRGGKVGFSNID